MVEYIRSTIARRALADDMPIVATISERSDGAKYKALAALLGGQVREETIDPGVDEIVGRFFENGRDSVAMPRGDRPMVRRRRDHGSDEPPYEPGSAAADGNAPAGGVMFNLTNPFRRADKHGAPSMRPTAPASAEMPMMHLGRGNRPITLQSAMVPARTSGCGSMRAS